MNKQFLDLNQYESFATMFFDSMMIKLDTISNLETQFRDYLYEFEQLVNNKTINLDLKYCSSWIEKYLEVGIGPISHSTIYKECYHPHYRVIHQTLLKNKSLLI